MPGPRARTCSGATTSTSSTASRRCGPSGRMPGSRPSTSSPTARTPSTTRARSRVRRRFSKQLFVRAAYTYAKSIDESSNTGGTIQYNFADRAGLAQPEGRAGALGLRHRPLFRRQFHLVAELFAAPAAARLADLRAPAPSTPGRRSRPRWRTSTTPTAKPAARTASPRARWTTPTVDQWFDRTVFPVVPVGSYRFGNSGRNILDGPGTININTSLSRRIRFAREPFAAVPAGDVQSAQPSELQSAGEPRGHHQRRYDQPGEKQPDASTGAAPGVLRELRRLKVRLTPAGGSAAVRPWRIAKPRCLRR